MKEASEYSELESKLLERLKDLSHFNDLLFVTLYGSQITGSKTKRSDIDVCLHYELDKDILRALASKISGNFLNKYDLSFFELLLLQVRMDVLKGD